jgi:TolB-like protein
MQHISLYTPASPHAAAPAMVAALADLDDREAGAVRLSLRQMLASENFAKAQRMSRLITFLVETELSGEAARLNEYVVGIEVFDRDARSYSTCEDPIVRVQMGRLRERLANYHAHAGASSAYRFSVPLGSYGPVIERAGAPVSAHDGAMLLSVIPLVSCNPERDACAFTQGLNEELAFRLFHAFSQRFVPHHFAQTQASPGKPQRVTHVLEGSVRASPTGARISLRVIDIGAGCVTWCEQFDRVGQCDMPAQEEVANTVCGALQQFFCGRHER